MATSVLVTGSSTGFGRLISHTAARSGLHVFATMREVEGKNTEAAEALRDWGKSERTTLGVIELDVCDNASVVRAIEEIIARAGRIDVVVNNAGIGAGGYLEGFTIEQIAQLLDVNVLGAARVNRAVLPYMREQQSGLLIHVSSANGRLPIPFMGAYNASKHALEALAQAYRYELRPIGIDSVIVEPGGYPTEIFGNALSPSDGGRLDGYAPLDPIRQRLFGQVEAELSGPDAPDPQEVADAVQTLIETPTQDRPLRTVIGSVATAGVDELNRAADVSMGILLADLGVADVPEWS